MDLRFKGADTTNIFVAVVLLALAVPQAALGGQNTTSTESKAADPNGAIIASERQKFKVEVVTVVSKRRGEWHLSLMGNY